MELPIEMFHISKKSADGRQSMCKKCKSEYSKLKVEEQRKKIAEATKAVETMAKNSDSITLKDGTVLRKVDKDCKPLSDYTPRELLTELKSRGYVWENMYIKQTVDYNKI